MNGVNLLITVSLCMIVKNEEETLAKCLDSVYDLVDEINIVDTGSTDKTIEVAKKYTNRIFSFPWTGKFKDARNKSFEYATKDYIFYLDADDILLEEDRKKLIELKHSLDNTVDAVSMFYQTLDEYEQVILTYRRNRLVKRERNFLWHGDAHNYLQVEGNIYLADIAVTHKKRTHAVGRNLNIYQNKLAVNEKLSARDYFYYGNELRENGLYKEAIEAYTKNISIKSGWKEDKIFACIFRADCYGIVGETRQQIASLLDALLLSDSLKPEICCRIGQCLQKKQQYDAAIWWYQLALNIPFDPTRWGFTFHSYATWYPHIQLCICYYNIQEFDKANMHNEKALAYRPQEPQLLFNQQLLKNKRKKKPDL